VSLLKTSALNGIAVGVRIVVALFINKILAVYVGPSGYAIVGQFQNVLAMVAAFATGSTGNGIVKLTAEYGENQQRQRRLWQTAATIVCATTLIGGFIIFLLRQRLAVIFLYDSGYSSIFAWVAICLPLIAFNALLLAIMNGRKEIRRYIISNIVGSIISLVLTGLLAWRFGLYGALTALTLSQGVVLFVTLQQATKTTWFQSKFIFGRIDTLELRKLSGFVIMALTTAIVSPLSQIFVRSALTDQFGLQYAGYWDAMWRISSLYLLLVTSSLSLYYLPRIAEIKNWPEMRIELIHVYSIVIPFVIGASFAIFLCRDIIVSVLFSSDFFPMRTLFPWQLIGDVVKIASWLLAFLMVGRGMIGSFVVTEIIAGIVFWLATIYATRVYGFEGVAIAHFITYMVYFCLVAALTIATPKQRAAMFVQEQVQRRS